MLITNNESMTKIRTDIYKQRIYNQRLNEKEERYSFGQFSIVIVILYIFLKNKEILNTNAFD